MSVRAILFDLDDTLLTNDMGTFLPRYFPLLADHVENIIDKDHFLKELLAGTQAMIANNDRGLTNSEVFWLRFCEGTGLDRRLFEPVIRRFYLEKFGDLQQYTSMRPVARELVELCFNLGYKVVIATNPLFPRIAIEARLEWAGLSVEDFDFDLVTAYENMHAAKPNVDYYVEILRAVGVVPEQALMVGDDWVNDMEPAARLGLRTFWVTGERTQQHSNGTQVDGSGPIERLHRKLSQGWPAIVTVK